MTRLGGAGPEAGSWAYAKVGAEVGAGWGRYKESRECN